MRVMRVIAAALALAGSARAAEPVTIRVGWAVVPANLAPLLTAKPGLARHAGTSYALELTHFTGTPQQMEGFAAGEVDLASFGYSTFAIAVENAGLGDARIVADIMEDGAHGANSNEFMVLKDGPVRAVEDLKGKIFATIGGGGTGDIAMRVMLRRHGLDDKSAVTYVEVAFPAMKSMLLSGKADIVTAVTPFSKDPELRASARTLFTQADAIGPTELLMLVGHEGFLAKNRAAVVDFLEDDLRAVRWYTDPANHDEAVAIVARFTKQPPALYQSWLFTKTGDQYRAPDGIPDIPGATASVAMQAQFGFIKAPLDVARYADLSLVKEAAGRL
jgi:sulfonate transport system substrate-binding protein